MKHRRIPYLAASLIAGLLSVSALTYAVYCLIFFDEDYWLGELIFIGWSALLAWLSYESLRRSSK